MESFFATHRDLIRQLLAAIDAFATDNVMSGRGGPFAAQLALFSVNRHGECLPVILFPLSGNMVLETGIASFHAEAQALSNGNIAILKQKIRELAYDKQQIPIVVLLSSAQPCMACLTKIEICARYLVHENLISPKNFLLVYGATYDATESVAGFHDYAYALDFFNFRNNIRNKYNLIDHSPTKFYEMPEEVHNILHDNALIESVVVRDQKVVGLGYDQRTENDYFKTAECVAIHAASRALKESGNSTPWSLKGACLYTINPCIGPLSYAECQWANISLIKPLSIEPDASSQLKHLDCPNCTNDDLFQRLSEGYNTPWSMIRVVHDKNYANNSQKVWSDQMNRIVYNGCNAGPSLTVEEKQIFDNLFVADCLI